MLVLTSISVDSMWTEGGWSTTKVTVRRAGALPCLTVEMYVANVERRFAMRVIVKSCSIRYNRKECGWEKRG